MPPLTGEQVVALATLLIGSVGGAVGAVWRLAIRPQERRISDVERAQKEAQDAREALQSFVMARVSQAEKERDAAIARAEAAISSNAILSDLLKELAGVVRDGNKTNLEEIRSIRLIVESTQRSLR